MLHGVAGCGKTAAMGCITQRATLLDDTVVVARFAGVTAKSKTVPLLITSICNQIAAVCGKSVPLPDTDTGSLLAELPNILQLVAPRRLVLVIDALDLLNTSFFAWVPKNLPGNIRVVVSVLSDEVSMQAKGQRSAVRTDTDELFSNLTKCTWMVKLCEQLVSFGEDAFWPVSMRVCVLYVCM